MPPERLVFAGTPEFAERALRALHSAGFSIDLVLTQPDRPSGRGLKLPPSPVKRVALEYGLDVFQPATLRAIRKDGTPTANGAQAQARLRAVAPDAIVVAAYGLILPPEVIDLPACGCINIHASVLPRWRGAAPIQRAIEAGDATTGISIMRMDAGLDTGPVLLEEAMAIEPNDTAGVLQDRLADLGAGLIVQALRSLDDLVPRPQLDSAATYAAKIEKHEAALDFTQPADRLARRIRAFNPAPGAFATLVARGSRDEATTVKCWFAEPVEAAGVAGRVLAADERGIVVACGAGALRITELQRAGGKRLSAREFLVGMPVEPGDRFDRGQ